MKSTLVKVLLAGLVGGGAFYAGGYATNKIPKLGNGWGRAIIPAFFIGIGILLARRGRLASGFGLAGAGGAIGMLALQMRAAEQDQGGASAGLGDAGARDGGLYDRPAPAGALFGPGGKNLLEQQNALGWGDAGALFGSGGRAIREQANAMRY